MRYMLILTALLIMLPEVRSQTSNPVTRAGLVKDAVGTIAGSDKKYAEVILNDLREFKGRIVAVDDNFFVLEPKKKRELKITVVVIGKNPTRRPGIMIRYRDVLQISGKHAIVSFVPDPSASPYSTWDEVCSIGRGEFVQVHRSSGNTMHGVLYRTTPDSLSLMRGNKEVVISAAEITKVYRIKGDHGSLATRILTGGTLGAQISEDWLPIGDPRSNAHPIGAAIGAAVGATLFVLSIGKTQRVLVHSK